MVRFRRHGRRRRSQRRTLSAYTSHQSPRTSSPRPPPLAASPRPFPSSSLVPRPVPCLSSHDPPNEGVVSWPRPGRRSRTRRRPGRLRFRFGSDATSRGRRRVRRDDDDDTVARAASSRVVERGDVDVDVDVVAFVVVVDARGGGEPRARRRDEGDDDDDDDAGRGQGDGWIDAVRDARCARVRGRVRGVRGRVDVDAREPGASPLRRSPAPASAMRGAFIPGALTDGGLSERASAVLRGAKGSPKKFGAFLRVVRGLRAEDALIQCNLSPKRVAKTIGRVIQSAIGNAVNNQGLDRDRLVVAEATCGKGQYLRRVSIHGRGRAGTMHRPRSHVRVTLEETDEEPRRRVRVHDDEMPWERRRRLGRAKQAIAEAAGIA